MKTKHRFAPRTLGLYGMAAPALRMGGTWIESEMLCTDHGKFERVGLVRHTGTGALVRVRLDVADTYFSIPATTAKEHGYVTGADYGPDYGSDLVFVPHTEQTSSPAQFRRETRKAYR